MPRHIVIITSAHQVHDKRVFQRHALYLRQAGFRVSLIAPYEHARDEIDGVEIHGFPGGARYLSRLRSLRGIAGIARGIGGDLYHLHDPDLLPVGLYLRHRTRVPVVYDAHEDFPLAARTARGFGRLAGVAVGMVVSVAEEAMARSLDAVVCAHRSRLAELAGRGQEQLFLPNYPPRAIYGELPPPSLRGRSAIYTGLLSDARGAQTILDAAAQSTDITYVLFAGFPLAGDRFRFESAVRERGLTNLQLNGFVPFNELPGHLLRAGVGIMPWAATEQHRRGAQPSKLYEYMAAALPVVASDLPITREVVAGNRCGLLHRPGDAAHLVECIRAVLDDPAAAAAMAGRGQEAFRAKYNYEVVGAQLISMYERLWTCCAMVA